MEFMAKMQDGQLVQFHGIEPFDFTKTSTYYIYLKDSTNERKGVVSFNTKNRRDDVLKQLEEWIETIIFHTMYGNNPKIEELYGFLHSSEMIFDFPVE